jgi:hypothetical protein
VSSGSRFGPNFKHGKEVLVPPKSKNAIVVRALHTTQGDGLDVYAFFIKGGDIVRSPTSRE